MIQPTEIRFTPLSATARTVSSVMPPEASEIARPRIRLHGVRELGGRHVVEQDHVGARRERLLELGDRLHLAFDLDQVPDEGARALDRRRDAAGSRPGGCP